MNEPQYDNLDAELHMLAVENHRLTEEIERLRAALRRIVSDGHEQFDGECLSACAACVAEEALKGEKP